MSTPSYDSWLLRGPGGPYDDAPDLEEDDSPPDRADEAECDDADYGDYEGWMP